MEGLVIRCLNHKPIMLYCKHINNNEVYLRKLFTYETGWGKEEDCEGQVARIWSSNPNILFHQLLARCGHNLKRWRATKRYNLRHDINVKSAKLFELQEKEDYLI